MGAIKMQQASLNDVISKPVAVDADLRLPGYQGNRRSGPSDPRDQPVPYDAPPPPLKPSPIYTDEELLAGIPEDRFGADDRELVNRTTYPYSAICYLAIRNRQQKLFHGTGFLAGPRLVLTAGHNVYYHGEGFMQSITVYPGLNGSTSSPPYQAAASDSFITVEAWQRDRERQFDIGAIFLPTDLGREAGWLSVARFTADTLKSLTVTLSGYPRPVPNSGAAGTQWYQSGKMSIEANVLRYLIDTSIGQSGSPVFASFPHKTDPYQVVGIHNTAYRDFNAATRINDAVFSRILEWRKASEA
jgi:V8-like Glu-specific endopeptidase